MSSMNGRVGARFLSEEYSGRTRIIGTSCRKEVSG